MRTEQPQNNCHEKQNDCGYIAKERNRYFTGKYMTARDFADEQSYFLSHHRLHNRLLHGWGIVCGLKVIRHPSPNCKATWVVIQPGIALDCCGRELIIECETAYKLPLPKTSTNGQQSHPGIDTANPAAAAGDATQPESASENEEAAPGDDDEINEPFLLVLRYVEEESEHVPALYSEGHCDPSRKEANRIREKAVLDVVRLDDVDQNCWRDPEGDPEARCRDDCAEDLPGPGGSCLKPFCPCGHVVPLALITPTDWPGGDFDIDLRGRRYLPKPPEFLTHIVDTNWTHGGEVTLEEINNDWNGRLEVRFDRKLLPADGDRTGIGPFTFVVQYGGVQQAMEFLPYDSEYPPTLEDDCLAVFTIDPDYINTRRDRRSKTIVDNFVYVTIKCNYILDCHDNPVDGDFPRALFPTGDGVPGGTFESWFRVVYESDYDQDEDRPSDDYEDRPKGRHEDRPRDDDENQPKDRYKDRPRGDDEDQPKDRNKNRPKPRSKNPYNDRSEVRKEE